MQHVKEINGVKFYEATTDGSQTAEIRSIMATQYMNREFIHGLPLAVAQELYKEILNKVHANQIPNEEKLQLAAVLVHNLQVRIANVLNTDNLLGLACIYFYMDGENPADYSGSFDMTKYNLMKSADTDTRLFFCIEAWKYTPKLNEISELDLVAYLKASDSLIHSQIMNTQT